MVFVLKSRGKNENVKCIFEDSHFCNLFLFHLPQKKASTKLYLFTIFVCTPVNDLALKGTQLLQLHNILVSSFFSDQRGDRCQQRKTNGYDTGGDVVSISISTVAAVVVTQEQLTEHVSATSMIMDKNMYRFSASMSKCSFHIWCSTISVYWHSIGWRL